jgi:hypothetical protein
MIVTSIEALQADRGAWLKGGFGNFELTMTCAKVTRLAAGNDRFAAALTGIWEEKAA